MYAGRPYAVANKRLLACFVLALAGCSAPEFGSTGTPSPSATGTPVSIALPSSTPVEFIPAPTPPPDSAAGVAAELVRVETAIRAENTNPRRLPGLGRNQQDAYRRLIAHPAWLPQVLASVPPELHQTIRANMGAGVELGVLNEPVPAIPRWRIVKPPPPEELLSFYVEAEGIFGVSWAYLAAINLVETNMGRIQGLSSAGAQGPMQFIPSTWAIYGRGDVNNPHDAILAAARYLRAAGAPADMRRALYAYNPSQLYVRIIINYAEQMLANERAYLGYYYWQVHVETNHGDVLLEEGYGG
jgi:hypothetical protein